jgi:hypothetical protein
MASRWFVRWEVAVAVITCGVCYLLKPDAAAYPPRDGGTSIDGLAFPPAIKIGGHLQQLTGGGTRTKYGVAKVYAVALYLDSTAASKSLGSFAGPSAPKKQPKFYQALIDGPFARTLYLQFHRSVAADAMVNALDEALAKRLSAAVLEKFRNGFLAAIPSSSLAKGAHVYFMCKGGR